MTARHASSARREFSEDVSRTPDRRRHTGESAHRKVDEEAAQPPDRDSRRDPPGRGIRCDTHETETAVKYLILLKSNPEWQAGFAALTPEQMTEGLALYTSIFTELAESGELVDAEQLAGPDAARRVSLSDAGVPTDGPYAETKEFLGGYYIVDVPSYERALEIAGRFPEAGVGLVEIHPIVVSRPEADVAPV